MAKLQTELKKQQPFAVPEQEAALNLLRTSDLIQNRFGRLFREHGLTSSQYNVLRILRGEGRPLACQEITERMLQVVPAMTGLLDRLEQQSLVQRQRSTEDRRIVFVEITLSGKELLQRLDQPVQELHRQLLGHFSQPELLELNRLLEKAREQVSAV